ncbi:MAG TPA: hypothetical protein PKH07_12560 [bacterium]|nr:hypothetical protein [bacterium]
MKRIVIIGLLVLSVCGPVAECNAMSPVTRYLKNRWNDFLDLFIVEVGMPQRHLAWGAHLRLTDMLQVGQIHFQGVKAGLDGRALIVVNEEKDQRSIPLYESYTEIDQTLRWSRPDQTQWLGRPIIRNGRYEWNDGRDMPWSVGLEIMFPPCFGGLELGLAFCQLGDFAFGLLNLDPWNDDIKPMQPTPEELILTAPVPQATVPGSRSSLE